MDEETTKVLMLIVFALILLVLVSGIIMRGAWLKVIDEITFFTFMLGFLILWALTQHEVNKINKKLKEEFD